MGANMSIYRLEHPLCSKKLFEGWNETIIWSCLQGIMGNIYADDSTRPNSAMAILGDFAFFAGEPNQEIVEYKPDGCNRSFIIMVPADEPWEAMIEECFQKNAKKVTRYAMSKEIVDFNPKVLRKYAASLEKDYSIQFIDRDIFQYIRLHDWCRDLCSQFESYEQYQKLGLGVVAMKNKEVIAGASSYSVYQSGIEIEIDTRRDFRRKGLATACGAALILECLKRGLDPSWDAQNPWSAALAKKLGYHVDYEYTAYEIAPWCTILQ